MYKEFNPDLIDGYTLMCTNYDVYDKLNMQQYINKPDVLRLKGQYYVMGYGSSDDVSFYTDATHVYILSCNYGLSYCGLSVIDVVTSELQDVVFLQSQDDIDEIPNYDIITELELLEYLTQWIE